MSRGRRLFSTASDAPSDPFRRKKSGCRSFSENGWSKNLENDFGERVRMSVPPTFLGFSKIILDILGIVWPNVLEEG